MPGVVNPRCMVYIDNADYTSYLSTISVNHEVQTLSPTYTIIFSKNLPITGGEGFGIYMGYGSTLVPMLTGGTISTFSRTLTQHGVEFVVNGRGPLSKLLDEAPELDQIYVPTWDKAALNDKGEWVKTACGVSRTHPVPLGIDPKQDVSEYEIFSADWTVHSLLQDILKKLGLTGVLNIPDFKYREVFKILRTQTWYSAIQQLVSVWEPLIFMRSNIVYILDTDVALPESSNIQYGPDSCMVTTINYSKNDIINRIIIKGGVDESVTEPEKKDVWIQPIDYMTEIIPDDLGVWANETASSEHPTPGSGSGGFTGDRIKHAYFKPMFGDPILAWTKKIQYYKGNAIGYTIEKNYYRAQGNYGSDQSVCTNIIKKRTQSWIVNGYYNSDFTNTWISGSLYIEKGFSGGTITDAADPTTTIGDVPSTYISIGTVATLEGSSYETDIMSGDVIANPTYGGFSLWRPVEWIKVRDIEEMADTVTTSSFSSSVSREFGILPKNSITSSAIVGLSGSDTRAYYLIGSPVTAFKDLFNMQKQGMRLSYRIIAERVAQVDTKYDMAIKQNTLYDYTKMTSDYDYPVVTTDTEIIPTNPVLQSSNKKKPLYQFEEYFEDEDSIAKYGYRPIITYYDPSILNHNDAQRLANKVFAKSGRIEEEISIQSTIGNPLLYTGKSIILESSTYKQINFVLQNYENTTILGGEFIINGIRHNFTDADGFKTELSLRKLWKLY